MRKLFALFISFYQAKLSPLKGFKCAHRGLHGGDSCSEFTKQQILRKGILASFSSVKQRFNECREAAETINKRPPIAQRGDCDCGIGGCDFASCDLGGGSSTGTSCAGCGDLLSLSPLRLLLVLIVVAVILVCSYYYFYGRQIESVNIRLNNGIEETTDGGALAKLFRSQKPDYRVNFYLKDGLATTQIQKNASAKEWINLKVAGSFYFNDITKMVIVNQELTNSKVLETVPKPQRNGAGELFEYSIKQRWELF